MMVWFWTEWQMPEREAKRLSPRAINQFLEASQRRKKP